MIMSALAHASIDRLQLVSLRIEPAEVPAQHQYTMRPAPVERFVYVTRGEVCFSLDQGKLHAGQRDMVYLPRDTAYHSQWLQDSSFMVIDLLLKDSEGQDIRFEDAPRVLFHDNHNVYDGLLKELAAKADASGPFDWLERLSLSFKLLCEMARDTNRSELDEQNLRIQSALRFLDNNFTDDISVEALAKMCSLSLSTFRRIFSSAKGISPVEYRNRLRVRKATELLKSGRYTVAEAAEAVGIGDIRYFCKLFKRYIGMSPGALKRTFDPEA